MSTAKTLNSARKNKDDEYYTRYEDIAKEVVNYKSQFKRQIVYCNCDDYRTSEFYRFFKENFQNLQLKKLIATNYSNAWEAFKAEYDGKKETISKLIEDGSYKSREALNILAASDVIVTNPPFSLFRDYLPLIANSGKKYLILGNQNAVKYKEIFPYIVNNKMWLGTRRMGCNMWFYRPKGREYEKLLDGRPAKHMSCIWYTNLNVQERSKPLQLDKHYSTDEYSHFEGYNAINCDKVLDIPNDYKGVIGVPISFLSYYCPQQFEILGVLNGGTRGYELDKGRAIVNGKEKYSRILIRQKQQG